MSDVTPDNGDADRLTRSLDEEGRELRSSIIRHALSLAAMSVNNGKIKKIKPEQFNVHMLLPIRNASESMASVRQANVRAGLMKGGDFRCFSLTRRDIRRLRGPGTDAQEWNLAFDCLRLERGYLMFMFNDLPILAGRDLVARYAGGDGNFGASFREAVGDLTHLALAFISAALYGRKTSSIVVLPARDGVFIGTTEPILSASAGRILYNSCVPGNTEGVHIGNNACDVMLAADVRSFIHNSEMSGQQEAASMRLRRWVEANMGALRADTALNLFVQTPSPEWDGRIAEIRWELDAAFGQAASAAVPPEPYSMDQFDEMVARHTTKADRGDAWTEVCRLLGRFGDIPEAEVEGLAERVWSRKLLEAAEAPATGADPAQARPHARLA